MKITIEINTCADCKHSDHSGAFTKGGRQYLCQHRSNLVHDAFCGAEYTRLLNPEEPTKFPEEIPAWCCLKWGHKY